MPSFNFSIPKKVANKKFSKNKHKVILKDVKGVIWIDENAEYWVALDNFQYPIHPDCYSCKGKSTVYRQEECYKSNLKYIRNAGECYELNNNFWLPFGIGCVVCGDLIDIGKVSPVFIIKDCWTEYNNESHKALEFYRKHIKEINDIIRNRRKHEFK